MTKISILSKSPFLSVLKILDDIHIYVYIHACVCVCVSETKLTLKMSDTANYGQGTGRMWPSSDTCLLDANYTELREI